MTNDNRKSSFVNCHSAVGSVVAICGVAYLNRRDAWLYGMRVDPGFKGQGVATHLTRALFGIARKSGRTWIGLDTMNSPRKAPVFRITEKLGMKLEGIYATAGFRDLPRNPGLSRFRENSGLSPFPLRKGGAVPRVLAAVPGISRPGVVRGNSLPDWTGGQRVMFHEQYPLWLWSRIGLARGSLLPGGTPVQIVRRRYGGRLRTSVNLLAEPADLMSTLAELLRFAASRGKSLVINYPADWTSRMRAASRRLKVPEGEAFLRCLANLQQEVDRAPLRRSGRRYCAPNSLGKTFDGVLLCAPAANMVALGWLFR